MTRTTKRGSAPVRAASVAFVALLTMTGLQSNGATASSGEGGDGSTRFTVDSPFVRDARGRARLFHGVNAVWKLDPYFPPSSLFGTPRAKSYFDDRDARFLSRTGLNSVRLGVLFAGVEPKRDDFDETYIRKMLRLTRMLKREGVTVMVDFHQDMYNERFDGEGFPDWAVKDDGVPPTNCCGFPGNYFTPAVTRTFDNLWENEDGLWDEYKVAWKKVARRFRSEPNLLGYDLLNEPWPGSDAASCANPAGCPAFDTEELQPFFEHVMAGIRRVDPTGIIWWDANVITNSGAKNNVGLLDPIDPSTNQGISFHVYCIAGSPTTGIRPGDDPSCPQSEPIAFENQHEAAERNESSLFLTEFGASDDLVDLRRVTKLADRHMVSWHYWHYGNWRDPTTTGTGGEQGLFRDDLRRPESLKNKKARILIRAYPQAVAGTPEAFDFHPLWKLRRFRLVYEADETIEAPTVVFLPPNPHYPNGYEVDVSGPAEVVSRNDARRLLLENTSSGEVRVTVRRTERAS